MIVVFTGHESDASLIRVVATHLHEQGVPLLVFSLHEDAREWGLPAVVRPLLDVQRCKLASYFQGAVTETSLFLSTHRNIDLAIVLGDRPEALAFAEVSMLNSVPVYHLYAGDVSGCIDDKIRFQISDISVSLFSVSADAERRLRARYDAYDPLAGRRSILSVGPVMELPDEELLKDWLPWLPDRYHVVHFHPNTSHPEPVSSYLDTVDKLTFGSSRIFLKPNGDDGSSEILRAVQGRIQEKDALLVKRLPRKAYLALLRGAMSLHGNSSAFVHEAPLVGVSDERIHMYGQRQSGRVSADLHRPCLLRTLMAEIASRFAYVGFTENESSCNESGQQASRSW
jgi:UDP-N-acetylglucosamine 2-epimerase